MAYTQVFDFLVGDSVWDDLTNSKAKIIGIGYFNGHKFGEHIDACHTVGYWLDNAYLGGARHPWEITKLETK